MESRKRLYKAGPRDNPTLTDRVQRHKALQQNARGNRFQNSRQIPTDGSPSSPQSVRPVIKVSEITDRNEKLKAYRLEKNSKKFHEIQEQRSPFIAVVPGGRWVEKKERIRPVKMELINTPVKTALMNERLLKKSTVKNLIAKSTVKKENVMIFEGKKKENPPMRSKKKILAELNSMESTDKIEEDGIVPFDLNSTIEISPEILEAPAPVPLHQRLRRSKSFADIVKQSVEIKVKTPAKAKTPPAKFKRQATAVIKKPIVLKNPVVFAAKKKEVPVLKKKTQAIKSSKFSVEVVEVPQASQNEPAQQIQASKPAAKKQPVKRSYTYSLYSSSLDTQTKFLTMEHKHLINSKDSFFELLSEDQQMSVQLAIQQGNLLLTDKLGKFAEFLEKFEDDKNHPERAKRITEDDVENYWYLIYEEIDKMKSDFHQIHTIKKNVLAAVASAKKRRTRRTYVPDEGTPKRSKRIAETSDTPKHNASCFGCVTMSATKINTPKSAKRRTTGKKSVAFENVETPKRTDSNRRSTKNHKATPKRNLMRMNAVDFDVDDENLNFA